MDVKIDCRLSIKEVVNLVGRSKATIERDYKDGLFPKPEQFRAGGRRYWRRSVIEPFIAPLNIGK